MANRVLITGGAGFIGSKIAESCARRGLQVRVFDLFPSHVQGVSESLTGSILDPYEIARAARDCDYVVHAAAALGVQRTETRRLECLYINVQGTVNVLEAAVKERVQKILFTSSSEVYGDQNLKVCSEDSPVSPKSNYAITKLVGEEYLRAYHASYNLKYAIVRFFNVYGKGQSPEFVIPKFARMIEQGAAPTVYGSGAQIRSFCHVEDAANGAALALLSPKADLEIFNIGNDAEPITIADLAHKMADAGGGAIPPRFVEYEDSDREAKREIQWRVPSIRKAREILGYKPLVTLDQGLKQFFGGGISVR